MTGLIKANITNRIAFNVATGIDSRVIIDQMGAEKLTGLGDMLFSKVDWGKPRRIQGCFVSDDEINEIVEFVKSQSEPDYHEEILSAVAPASMSMAGGGGIVRTGVAEPQDDDPLIWEAAHIVVESQLGSTSACNAALRLAMRAPGVLWTCWKKRVSSARPTALSRARSCWMKRGLPRWSLSTPRWHVKIVSLEDSDGCTLW